LQLTRSGTELGRQ